MASLIARSSFASTPTPVPTGSGENVRVPLAPVPGFCIKSVTTEPGFYTYTDVHVDGSSSSFPSSSSSSRSKSEASPKNLLEPKSKLSLGRQTLQIPKGIKVFLNIAWDKDKRVPSPPEVSEDVIRRAMAGADLDDYDDDDELGGYYVPVVVSEPREDLDKKGQPSIVFDCVFSASLKSRCLKDKEFKLYLIELALEHVEEKAHTMLSRQVGTPNIASKGKLEPRTVLMPRALVDPKLNNNANANVTEGTSARGLPLIQELPAPLGSSSPANTNANSNKENKNVHGYSTGGVNDNDITTTNQTKQQKKKSILKQTSAGSNSGTSNASTLAAAVGPGRGAAAAKKVSIGRGDSGGDSGTHFSPSSEPIASSSIGTRTNSAAASTSAGSGKEQNGHQYRPPLIQEISTSTDVDSESGSGPRTEGQRANGSVSSLDVDKNVELLSKLPPLRWRWEEVLVRDVEKIKIEIHVPALTREAHAITTLDIEPRRILLHVPNQNFLDINLALSDEQIGKMGQVNYTVREETSESGEKDKEEGEGHQWRQEEDIKISITESMQVDSLRVRGHNAGETLRLKKLLMQRRRRDVHDDYFDVENARAEWRMGEKKLVITV